MIVLRKVFIGDSSMKTVLAENGFESYQKHAPEVCSTFSEVTGVPLVAFCQSLTLPILLEAEITFLINCFYCYFFLN